MLFALFILIVSSLLVIGCRNPIHAMLALVSTFICSAILLINLEVEFLAFSFIIIYVGAIAILFLFIIMMIDIKEKFKLNFKTGYFLLGFILFFLFSVMVSFPVSKAINTCFLLDFLIEEHYFHINWFDFVDNLTNLEQLGQLIYIHYSILLLLAGFVLFVSIIGSLMLTVNLRKTAVKRQILYKQVARQRKNSFIINK